MTLLSYAYYYSMIRLQRNIIKYFKRVHYNLFCKMATSFRMDIGDMRKSYCNKETIFLEKDISVKEPIALFEEWFKQVREDPRTVEANAMCVSTATKDGLPSARYCLLKGFSKEGFIFFTHYTSRKGQQLEENPNAALTFYWDNYSRSVRIEGPVEKLPFSHADEYFSKRPYRSQIGALCSDQSKPVEGRHVLEEKAEELTYKYKEGEVPRPPMWGGYIVKPIMFEFWQGQSDRIHDRLIFRKPKENEPDSIYTHSAEDGWVYERLNP